MSRPDHQIDAGTADDHYWLPDTPTSHPVPYQPAAADSEVPA